MTREEILAAAQKCVCGDREQDYGSPERSFGVIGQFWETYLQVTLHQEFGFGYDRIKRLTDAWGRTYNQFHDALDGGTEADYWQEKLDRLLLDLLRDHQALIPFGERYPEIREITYGPRRAGKEGKA